MRRAVIQIVEDHPAISYAIASAVNSQKYTIGSRPESVSAAIDSSLCHPIDLVILDLRLPGLSGESLLQHYRKTKPNIPILIYSATSNLEIAARCLNQGAKGFVRKKSPFEELLIAIDKVHGHGERHIPEDLSEVLVSNREDNTGLTPREQEVMLFIAKGKTSKDIAKILNISERTVNIHRTNLMHKISASNVSEVTLYAVGAGVIEPSEFLSTNHLTSSYP
ncbi:MAG: response regulator transcription factor [Verrucomicrobiota bacterium]